MEYFHQKINYMFSDVYLKVGKSTAGTSGYQMHWHNCIELIYGYENDYDVLIGNDVVKLSNNDIILIPGRVMHGFYMENQSSPLHFIQFKVTPVLIGGDIINDKEIKRHSDFLIDNVIIVSKKDNEDLHSLLKQTVHDIIDSMNNCPTGYRYQSIGNIYIIIGLLKKYGVSDQYNKLIMNQSELTNMSSAFLYIEENYMHNITINDVAKVCGFNSKYFGRLFFKVTGHYFNDYINNFRVKKASRMLQDEPVNITNIAYECGFSSIPTFYRHFNKIHGCSPKEFISKFRL